MYQDLREESRWLIGRHSKVKFWTDNWLGSPLIDSISSPIDFDPPLESVVGDLFSDSSWLLPPAFKDRFSAIADVIKSVICLDGPDALYWRGSLDGSVSCSDAYLSISGSAVMCSWGK